MSKSQTYEIGSSQKNQKDKKISELRSKLDKLKQQSKDYDSLNSRYKQLLKEFSLMKEANNRLEYEIRQRESEYNRRISDLKAENETLKLGLNDKMTSSKKIFSENDIIEKEIALKNEEIKNLNDRLSDISYQYDKDFKNKDSLFNLAQKLHDNIIEQNEQICKLKEDNINLTKLCQENEKYIKIGESDINKLSNELNENTYDLQNISNKVNIQEKNLNNLQNKLNTCNNMNLTLRNNIKKMEKEFDELRNDNDTMKNDLINERAINNDNMNFKTLNMQYKNRKDIVQIQNDKMKRQVIILENQNNTLINEIDNILEEDRKMKEIINRKTRITSLLQNNNDTLEKSIINLDKCSNNYDYDFEQKSSPRFTYQYYEY